jgi:hypothetical protein
MLEVELGAALDLANSPTQHPMDEVVNVEI